MDNTRQYKNSQKGGLHAMKSFKPDRNIHQEFCMYRNRTAAKGYILSKLLEIKEGLEMG